MEAAPLTLAHAHARKAAIETWNANSTTAGTEHELAATEFANAANTTLDPEALRILKLLEDHHHHLSELIKSPTKRTNTADKLQDVPRAESETTDSVSDRPASAQPARLTSPTRVSQSPATKTLTSRRKPPRDSASSIASNLATARGIKTLQGRTALNPTVSTSSAVATLPGRAERQSRLEAHLSPREAIRQQTRRLEELGRNAPSSSSPARSDKAGQPPSKASEQSLMSRTRNTSPSQNEEGFQRFFSTFETLYSALSAPLAFASLPLNPTASTPQATAPSSPNPTSFRTTSSTEDDYANLISKPALRAIREEQGPNGPFSLPQESFYVVPTSGGTVSYAGILHHSHSNPSHLPDLIEEDLENPNGSVEGDEFVDASENPQPPSPTSPRSVRSTGSRGKPKPQPVRFGARKTQEELELENTTLRQLLDKQSQRLQMWEASSQSQSLALAQSFRARGPPSLTSGVSDPAKLQRESSGQSAEQGDARSTEARIQELEALLNAKMQEVELAQRESDKLGRENEKLLTVLSRYRSKWDELKAGARKRAERGKGEEKDKEAEES